MQRAISEIVGLDAEVIKEEFVIIASYSGIIHNKFNTPLIDLEGFCILMERLETLGEDMTSDLLCLPDDVACLWTGYSDLNIEFL